MSVWKKLITAVKGGATEAAQSVADSQAIRILEQEIREAKEELRFELINLEKNSITRILLNARISKRSFRRWKKLGNFSKNIFKKFNYTYPQNQESKNYLSKMKK